MASIRRTLTGLLSQMVARIAAAVILTLTLSVVPAPAATWDQQAKLKASDATAYSQFGRSVSACNGLAIIGAQYDDEAASDAGAAYVFERGTAGEWTQATKLKALDAEEDDWFGHSVSVSGSYAIVGAYGKGGYHPHGAAYVFERGPSGWVEAAKLAASDGQAGDQFGYSVSIDGGRVVVGTAYAEAAYVFERDTLGQWSQTAKLTASDLPAGELVGQSVGISGDLAIIGAYTADDAGTSSGAAYVFRRDSAGNWAEERKLTASDPEEGEAFGWSVAINETRALVGAMWDNENGNDSGAAYVFDLAPGGGWSETAKLVASDGASGDSFGISVSLDGELVLVGANSGWSSPGGPTAAYAFEHAGGGLWNEVAKLEGRSDLRDYFGEAVAVTQDMAFVGAYADDDSGALAGAVYTYSVPEPSSLLLLGFVGIGGVLRKRRQ